MGPDCPGLSANTIVRLKEVWQGEYDVWSKRSLVGKEYVYVWADGIHSNVRLEADKVCLLVLIGVTKEGQKELLAVESGFRESKDSWLEVLRDLKRRGLAIAPKLAVGDGALGFWAALREEWPSTREQRCWVHKTANVLNKLAQEYSAQRQSQAARNLDGSHSRGGDQSLRHLPGNLRCEVRQSPRLPEERPR